MKKVYLLLADGFEIIEAMAPVDILRRSGVDVKMVSITNNKTVVSSHRIRVEADMLLEEGNLDNGDMLVLPGGFPGYENLGKSKEAGELLKRYYNSGKFVGAICGAPTVLAKYGVARGRKLTCHHSVIEEMDGYNYVGGPVVTDGNLITGVGAGKSIEFGFALASVLVDGAMIQKLKTGMELL